MKMTVCHLLNFEEWLSVNEARTYKAPTKPPKPHKHRPEPTVHHDLDTWLQHVDNLKKELEALKDKMGTKKDVKVTPEKPEEPKLLTFKQHLDKDEEKPDDEPEENRPDADDEKPSKPQELKKDEKPKQNPSNPPTRGNEPRSAD